MILNRPFVIYIMGVSGSGKSTIGSLLSKELSIPFFDGDDYHSEHNIKKMASGQPLNDDDRLEWLHTLNHIAKTELENNSCIIASSALKESYRTILANTIESQVKWVFLDGFFEQITKRIQMRKDHFMPHSLLASQFETLEIPINALSISIENKPSEIVKTIKAELTEKLEIGVIGLGIMGKSLCRNLARNDFKISMFNRHVTGSEENVAINFKEEHQELEYTLAYDDLAGFVSSLQSPRKILLMVSAGKAVDEIIEEITPYLNKNDVLIDGGNSHYKDTEQRINRLAKKEIHFIGAGISGGERGALEGPSIMPGGNKIAYSTVAPFLETIAATNKVGKACCAYIGSGGSGHFVKMVHNGIEYAEMQLLTEIYDILSLTNNPDKIADILDSWKKSSTGFLLEITCNILRKKENGDWLIDKILDKASHKGTGNWATVEALNIGVPSTMIATSVFSRYISALKEERMSMEQNLQIKKEKFKVNSDELFKSYELARIINHFQGFRLLHEASLYNDWKLNLSAIASIWAKGCIIRSELMETIAGKLRTNTHIFEDAEIIQFISTNLPSLKNIVITCISNNLPAPCLTEALTFLNGYTRAKSPANLIQAQRDYFGAHSYQRIDKGHDQFFHTNWTE